MRKSEFSRTLPGTPSPLGATRCKSGWNFALYCPSEPTLLLAPMDNPYQWEEITLDAEINRTGSIWHIFVKTELTQFFWGWKVAGRLLFDPYAKVLDTGNCWGSNFWSENQKRLIAIACESEPFDWAHDVSLRRPVQNLVLYEMHVRGFTQDHSSKVDHPGTFRALIEKIPYLKELGVNAIELMPICEFDETDCHFSNPKTKKPHFNYWGYSPLSFFALMQRYSSSNNPIDCCREFKELVKKLHQAGIEVILDLVFNHTGEGNELGKEVSLKGFSKTDYYHIAQDGSFCNYSGCGNTLNCNHSVVQDLIIASLNYFVCEYHVDGFRFDLASIFARGRRGAPLAEPPLIARITEEPILKNCKLIAEPWDAVGLHQVGTFFQAAYKAHERWMEWNDDFRTVVRRFIRGDEGYAGRYASKLCGSEDIYNGVGAPTNSVNFISCHDGFTLHDLVSYTTKHNLLNGEENRDGIGFNDSSNYGVEGETRDSHIERLREKQMKNFVVSLLVAQGVPMFQMGDEYGHTKEGNNNSYCQDNAMSWFQWRSNQIHASFLQFVKGVIELRKSFSILQRETFLNDSDIDWHSEKPFKPNWSAKSHFVAFTLKDSQSKQNLFIAFNAQDESVTCDLPPPPATGAWAQLINTGHVSPHDFVPLDAAVPLQEEQIKMAPYSSVVLVSL